MRRENSERAQGPRQELLQDISRELQKIKILEFSGGQPGKHTEAWLEVMKRCFALNEYTSSSKARMAIFQLKGDALNWWLDLKKQLHLTSLSVSWELFEERFNMKYLLTYYKEQQAGSFHALVQGNMTMEEYEAKFMQLVKYVPYLNSDDRQVERFVYGLNYKIRATVRMWNPT